VVWNSISTMRRDITRAISSSVPLHTAYGYRDARQHVKKLEAYATVLDGRPGGVPTLLDVGCGTGSLLDVYGPSLSPVESSRGRGPRSGLG
jgi:hypothetical protein